MTDQLNTPHTPSAGAPELKPKPSPIPSKSKGKGKSSSKPSAPRKERAKHNPHPEVARAQAEAKALVEAAKLHIKEESKVSRVVKLIAALSHESQVQVAAKSFQLSI